MTTPDARLKAEVLTPAQLRDLAFHVRGYDSLLADHLRAEAAHMEQGTELERAASLTQAPAKARFVCKKCGQPATDGFNLDFEGDHFTCPTPASAQQPVCACDPFFIE